MKHQSTPLAIDRELDPTADDRSRVPGRAPVTARLTSRQVLFRAADAAIARAFDEASDRPRAAIARAQRSPAASVDPFAIHLDVSSPGDHAELEADRAADAMVAGRPAAVGASIGLARDAKPPPPSSNDGVSPKLTAELIASNEKKAVLTDAIKTLQATKLPDGELPVATTDAIKSAAKSGAANTATIAMQQEVEDLTTAHQAADRARDLVASSKLRLDEAYEQTCAALDDWALAVNASQQDVIVKKSGLGGAIKAVFGEAGKLIPHAEKLGDGIAGAIAEDHNGFVVGEVAGLVYDKISGLAAQKEMLESEAARVKDDRIKHLLAAAAKAVEASKIDVASAVKAVADADDHVAKIKQRIRERLPGYASTLDKQAGTTVTSDLLAADKVALAVDTAARAYIAIAGDAEIDAGEGAKHAKGPSAADLAQLAVELGDEIDAARVQSQHAQQLRARIRRQLDQIYGAATAGVKSNAATIGTP